MEAVDIRRVSIKTFRENMAKWLKCVPLVLTRNGIDVYTIQNFGEKSVHNSTRLPTRVEEAFNFDSTYGCGCDKTDKRLCTKHDRF